MVTLSRRAFLASTAATLACTATPAPTTRRPPPIDGELITFGGALGHKVREPFRDGPEPASQVDVCIVGAGIAGLTCAWRLARAGFQGSVAWLDVGHAAGGTAMSGTRGGTPYPWGAHYVVVPNQEATHLHALLHDLGVITGFDTDGRPRIPLDALCLAPQERVFVAGKWVDGLWPAPIASATDAAELAAFEAEVRRYTRLVGADGKPAFTLPVAGCSMDPSIRALSDQTFADWADSMGLSSKLLRWYLGYGTRDDFGADLSETSAWAGLHYHCARRPWFADERDAGTHVITWPAGNGELVDRLLNRVPWRPTLPAVVRKVEPGAPARVWYEHGGVTKGLTAAQVVLAVPSRVVDLLVERPAARRVKLAPWRVAQLHVDRVPRGDGVPWAWDSVLFDAHGLGYVTNTHQHGDYKGSAVLTYYGPLPATDRFSLRASGWDEEVDRVLSDLSPAHPDLRARVHRVDVLHWGHGTAIPAVGLHNSDLLDLAAAPLEGVHPAHSDLSGMSLFEEASWHGIRAAEAVLDQLAGVSDPRLVAGAR